MASGAVELTDGGIETVMLFREGFELPCFAAFPLVADERGRSALRRYFEPFLDMAQELGLPFVLDTATWRANPDWGTELGYDDDALADANRAAVAFARELADGRPDVLLNGLLGPRGDGYVVGERMTGEQAADYHGWQIGVLAEAGVQRITALTLSYPEEAIGIVQAAAAVGVPVVAGFTVETDGRLPDGTSLADAVERVDEATGGGAEFFLINCAHPTHIAAGLDGTPIAGAHRRAAGQRVGAEPRRTRRGRGARRGRPGGARARQRRPAGDAAVDQAAGRLLRHRSPPRRADRRRVVGNPRPGRVVEFASVLVGELSATLLQEAPERPGERGNHRDRINLYDDQVLPEATMRGRRSP